MATVAGGIHSKSVVLQFVGRRGRVERGDHDAAVCAVWSKQVDSAAVDQLHCAETDDYPE